MAVTATFPAGEARLPIGELEVGAVETEVPEEIVRPSSTRFARRSRSHSGRGADRGPDDRVVADLSCERRERRDYASRRRGAVVDEIEQNVVGMDAGETKDIAFELADDPGSPCRGR